MGQMVQAQTQAEETQDREVIKSYKDKLSGMPPESAKVFGSVISLMEKGILPAVYPEEINRRYGANKNAPVQFTPLNLKNAEAMIGSDGVDHYKIEKSRLRAEAVGGDIGMQYTEEKNNDYIINPGKGDDVIEEGSLGGFGEDKYRAIFMFNKGWGHDVFDVNCHGQRLDLIRKGLPPNFWTDRGLKYNVFYVFGTDVNPADLKWETPFKIVDTAGGDTLTFKNSWCGHIIFARGGKINPFNWLEFYDGL